MYKHSDVWINRQHLGFHSYGYTSFACDLMPYVHFGAENALAVRLDNSQYLDV